MLQFPPWKIFVVIAICVLGVAYATPNLVDVEVSEDHPSWFPGKQIHLGLDLRGGSHLLLEVEVAVVVNERLEANLDSARRELRSAKIKYRNLRANDNGVTLTLRDVSQIDLARPLLRGIDPDMTVDIDDDGSVAMALTEDGLKRLKDNAITQSIEIVRRRIDETGTREPNIQRQGDDRILIQLPGVDDPDRIKRLLGETAKLTFQLVDTTADVSKALSGRVPPGRTLLPSTDRGGPSHYVIERRIMVSGENLVDAQASFDQNNQPVVSFRFDSVGAKRFAKATSANVGKPFAIVLDGEVVSAPVIREPILGGSGQISGSFTVPQVQDLSLLLRAGALPAPLTVLEERTVGPGLGKDSIEAGQFASMIGLVLVLVFMIACYGLFGLMANIALTINVTLIIAALSLLQATLTLPGIAGIVLTMGMAVDANVLIFERIREEVRVGRTPMAAIEAGYKRAITTIIDSNLTTLFAAICLYGLGSGPVRGFSVTLAIGIVTSMFTAVMVTRLLIALWVRRSKPAELAI